jgi:small subunit ribosomal protein S20
MPHSKSAKKRDRQNVARRDRNRALRSKLRTVTKKAGAAAGSGGGSEEAEQACRQAASELDKAARRGLIKKNQANRRKARLARKRGRPTAGSK